MGPALCFLKKLRSPHYLARGSARRPAVGRAPISLDQTAGLGQCVRAASLATIVSSPVVTIHPARHRYITHSATTGFIWSHSREEEEQRRGGEKSFL